MTDDEIKSLILRRRLQTLVHSCIYYYFDDNIISDAEWARRALELEELQKQYAATTPYQYPLYFLENEDFFHLKWKKTRIKTHTPSAKLIRENIEYAFLDNALWDLLQEQQMREDFHTLVINNFLK